MISATDQAHKCSEAERGGLAAPAARLPKMPVDDHHRFAP